MSPFPRIRSLATAVAGCLLAAAAMPAASSAVVNGLSVQNDGDFPWTVAIVAHGGVPSQTQFCGGTLIALDRVLTAAHCIDPAGANQARPDSIDVVVGRTSLSDPPSAGDPYTSGSYSKVGVQIPVSSISLHAQTEVTHFRYDVAILTLAQPIPSTMDKAIVAPVDPSGASTPDLPLPQPAAADRVQPGSASPEAWGPASGAYTGTDAYVFGWGARFSNDGTPPNVLRFAGGSGLERLSDTVCAQRYSGQFSPDDMLCVGRAALTPDPVSGNYAPVEDGCQGDSGGPLLKRAPVQDSLQSEVETFRVRFRSANAPRLETQYRASDQARLEDEYRDAHPGAQQPEVDAAVDALVAAHVEGQVQNTTENFARDLRIRQIASYSTEGRHWRLMGVVSFGVGCGDPRKPGVYSRVGAPKLYSYIQDATPTPMPEVDLARGPSLGGAYGAGGEITCDPGAWTDATTFDYNMWRDTNGDGKRGSKELPLTGTQSTGRYAVTATDLASSPAPIGCTVVARGGGGYASAAAPTYTPPVVQPTPPAGSPNPPAAPAPTTADTSRPIVSKSSSVCAATTCRVAVVVLDPDHGTAGVRTVGATLTIQRRVYYRVKTGANKGKLRSKLTTIRKKVSAKRTGDQWIVSLKGLKKGDKPKLLFEATDRSGNAGKLTVVLKLRPKR